MKKFGICLALTGLLGLGGQAFAEIGTIDAVPASTLLLPYFEVDLDGGVTTIFSVTNASAAPALAHVTLWTDWSQPSLDFDLYLTGYDVQTVNLADLFIDGQLPITADVQNDPADLISPHGNNPVWDDSFANCGPTFPFPPNILVGTPLFDRVRNAHTGQAVPGIACLGEDHGDNIARGYITIDMVSECSVDFPSDPNYFAPGGTGIANNLNQLIGDFFIVDEANDFAQGDTMVHIEADDTFTGGASTFYTFYGRYTQAVGGTDNREPLGTTWAARYLDGGGFDGGTDMIVWRDSTANNQPNGGFSCGVGPDWYPLNENEVVAFNEAEDAVLICFSTAGGVISPPIPGSDPACFPLETGRYQWGEGNLAVPYEFGWAYLNLNIPADAPTGDVDFPPVPLDTGVAQSFVSVNHDALGRFSVGYQAIPLTSATDELDPRLADLWIIPEP